jgi:hypothetical protein
MPQLKRAAIAESRGDIVAFLDPSDAVEPDWIDEMLPGLADPSVSAVGGSVTLSIEADANKAAHRAAYLFEYVCFGVLENGWAIGSALVRAAIDFFDTGSENFSDRPYGPLLAILFKLQKTVAAIEGHAEPTKKTHAQQLLSAKQVIFDKGNGDLLRLGLSNADGLQRRG